MASTSPMAEDPVAVVGFAFRYPQDTTDENSFWDVLQHGKSTMTEVPADRWNVEGHSHPDRSRQDATPARGGHFLKGDMGAFDAPFFTMSSAEAKAMDPQMRLLLETSYHAMESAGVKLDDVHGSQTSCYVGNLTAEYAKIVGMDTEINTKYQATGISGAMLSNRISWFYDMRGPSVTIDTACSSSLIGLHLGCQSLVNGDASMSLVAGVQLQLEPRSMTVPLSRLGFLSPTSQCHSFSDEADGYSRGEGVGVMVLKRLSKALADGDTIRAVIRGTGANQDGRTPAISQPSAEAQAALIRQVYEQNGLDLATTSYFEAHGTGTALGDRIETHGISMAFSAEGNRPADNPLYVGSAKANIGHLEAGAGLAGLIKSILSMERGVIPPVGGLRRVHPNIPAAEWGLRFATSLVPWPVKGLRRASINSFGFGGTNGHAVVDDAYHYLRSRGLAGRTFTTPTPGQPLVECTCTDATEQQQLFVLSASDEAGVGRQAAALSAFLDRPGLTVSSAFLQDLAYTLGSRRTLLPWKTSLLASSRRGLQAGLAQLAQKPVRASSGRPVVHFVFTGQGAQWVAMGAELLRYGVFRASLEACDRFLAALGAPWSLLIELQAPAGASVLDRPELAQPVCTALQVALVDLLASWGVRPEAVVGHSSGEIAAAYCAGALTRESAWRVAYFRGECAARLLARPDAPRGSMLAAGASEADLQPFIDELVGEDGDGDARGHLAAGCLNSPKSVTVTGDEALIVQLAARLQAAGIFARKLNVPLAYHSAHMLRIAEEYRDTLKGQLHAPEEAADGQGGEEAPIMFSSVTGQQAHPAALSKADYWVQNLVSQVKFAPALALMTSSSFGTKARSEAHVKPATLLLELGPHCVLERPVKDTVSDGANCTYDHVLRRNTSGIDTAKLMAGRLVMRGYPVDVAAVNSEGAANSSSSSSSSHDDNADHGDDGHHAEARRRAPRMLIDLPSYAFNHAQSYWLESRMSKNLRFRERPQHELLGNPCLDWNPLKPKWRFTIRTSDMPWTLDHQVQGTILYPATGMLVMAVEGVRALTRDLPGVQGYRLRDVKIGSALVIPEGDEGIEAQVHMHSDSTGASDKDARAWDFWIYTVAPGDEWKLHCSGQVSAEQAKNPDVVSGAPEEAAAVAREAALRYDEAHESCAFEVGKQKFYEDLWECGFHFGDKFNTLTDVRLDGATSQATAAVDFAQWRQQVRDNKATEHLVHPATLDSMLHVAFASIYHQWASLPTLVPTQFGEAWLSADLLSDAHGDRLVMSGRVLSQGLSHVDSTITALSSTTKQPLISLSGLRLSGLTSAGKADEELEYNTLFHHLHWKPDLALLAPPQVEGYCNELTRHRDGGDGIDPDMEAVVRHYVARAVREVPQIAAGSAKGHLRNYIAWAHDFLGREADTTRALEARCAVTSADGGDEQRERRMDEFAARLPVNAAVVKYGRNLAAILREEVDPLHLLFNEGLADDLYQSSIFTLTAHRLAAYMDLLAHKDSDLRILEVGAGTGSTTTPVLETLGLQGREQGRSPRYEHYDFTDISPSFFSKAQERYEEHAHRMRFKVLDIEKDVVEQGFEEGAYDVVIAVAVLHAVKNIDAALLNVKRLLKPGGKVLISEPTNRRMATIPYVFGCLSGWWLSEEAHRTMGPLMTKPEWHAALQRTGFGGGLELAMSDGPDDTHSMTLLVSTAAAADEDDAAAKPHTTAIVTETRAQYELAERLQEHIAARGGGGAADSSEIVSIDAFPSRKTAYDQVVCLQELENRVMDRMTPTQFEALRHMFRASNKILWVNDRCGDAPERPEAAMVSGFLKTLAREKPAVMFTHLNIEGLTPQSERNLVRVLDETRAATKETSETDLLEKAGVIHAPRVVEATRANHALHKETHGFAPEETAFAEGETTTAEGHPLELRFSSGRLDSFHFGPDNSGASRPLQAGEVEVAVKATGINFKDVMVALNQLSDNHIGQEFAGVVSRVGPISGLATSLMVGDRVAGIASDSGSFRTHIRVRQSHLMRVPDAMPLAEATALPVAYATVQYGLHHLGRLQRGETVLVHAAAGAVGQAAIRMAHEAGAEVFVTVSTPAKKELLMSRYGIDAAHVFSSRHLAFAQQVMQRTGGRGVDVVINSLSGRALTETWRCMAPFGRFVEIGKRDMSAFKSLPMEPFLRNVSFCSLDLAVVSKHKDALMRQIMGEVEQFVERNMAPSAGQEQQQQQQLAPYPLTTFRRSEFEQAFRFLQTGQHTGKAVIDWEAADTLQVIPKSPLDYQFSAEASYVIAGGLGGVGRNISLWMARNGARHLVLLNRSGPRKPEAQSLVRELEGMGVSVFCPPCDVSDEQAVMRTIFEARATMPPIRGCIQGAMVCDNRIFENYDLPGFQSSIDPKVRGTWNLHRALPPDGSIDFFVMLSSLAGFHGASSQSNYAAANTFQDAFARLRRAEALAYQQQDGSSSSTSDSSPRADRFGSLSAASESAYSPSDCGYDSSRRSSVDPTYVDSPWTPTPGPGPHVPSIHVSRGSTAAGAAAAGGRRAVLPKTARPGSTESCHALVLGIVDGFGYVAERADVSQLMRLVYTDHKSLGEKDLHFMLKYACRRQDPPPGYGGDGKGAGKTATATETGNPWESQLVGALTTPAYIRRGGAANDFAWMRIPVFRHLYRMEREEELKAAAAASGGGGSMSSGAQTDSAGALLQAAATTEEAAGVVTTLLARRLARSLAVPLDDIDVNRPPHAFGVDSLVAVELLLWFAKEVRAEVPVVQVLGNSTVAQLGMLAATRSEFTKQKAQQQTQQKADEPQQTSVPRVVVAAA